ncbi:hypothetical protein [Nocardia sp. NPDC004860]|uniref:hypothetical protein n=1 Tax=Nocardia sp. NPDC004860 TaxID=3154557 RepID=UPI0033BA95CF
MPMLAADIQMPPAEVTGPLTSLLGMFLWFVFAALIASAMWSGVMFARLYTSGAGLDRASTNFLVVCVCSLLAASASAWGGFLLL